MPPLEAGEKQTRVVRGRVDEIRVYEVTDAELERLEKGSPEALNFTAGIFFESVAVTAFVALLTTKIDSERVYTVFVVAIVVGFAVGTLLIIQYAWKRRGIGELVKKIKGRIPTEPVRPPPGGETSA